MQIIKFLVKSLQCLGLWKEVSFHLGFPTDLQRCRLLPPARFVSPSCKHTCTYIISSVRAVSLSQGVFPLGNLSTSYKVSGQRPPRPAFQLLRKKCRGFTDSPLLVQRYLRLFSLNPIFNLHFALLSQATNITLTRFPKQHVLSDSHRSNQFCSSDIIKLSIYICLSRNST